MALDANEWLRQGQGVAARFIAQFYPEESVYVGPLWKRCTKHFTDETHAAVAQMGIGRMDRLHGLCFAENRRLNLMTPFVVVTVTAVFQEMQVEAAIPSVTTFRQAVRRCAEALGAPRRLIDQMEQQVAESLHNLFQQARPPGGEASETVPQEPRQIIRVNLSTPTTVDGTAIHPQSRQMTALLCEFVRRRRLHWARGFVLFERWCRIPPANPKRVFQNIVAKLSMALKKEDAGLRIEPEKEMGQNTGVWRLVVPENVTVAGDVEDARACYEKARDFFQAGHAQKSAEALQEAIARDPYSVASAVLLSRIITGSVSGELFDGALLRKTWTSLRQAQASLRDAIASVTKKGEQIDWRADWATVSGLAVELEQELQEICEARIVVDRIVHNRAILSPDDLELSRIADMVRRIRATQNISGLIEHVGKIGSIADICRTVRGTLTHIFRELDFSEGCVADTVMLQVLCKDICCGGTDPERYASLDDLKRQWISALSIRCGEEVMELEYQITKAEQRFLREYATTCKQSHQRPCDSAQAPIQKTRCDERSIEKEKLVQKMESLSGRVDLGAYWDLFRKPSAKHKPYRKDTIDDGGNV